MTADAVGGIWTYALELGRAMAARGWQVTLAVVGPPASAETLAVAEDAGLAVVSLDVAPDWLASGPADVTRGGRALADLARRIGADLVHLNHPAFAAEVVFPAPVLAVCHSCVATWWAAVKGTPLPESFAWQATMVAQGYSAADTLVAPSAAFAAVTREIYGLPVSPVVVHNGRRRVPRETPDRSPSPMALTAGRLWDEGKDIATLARAAALTAVPIRAAGPVRGPNGAAVSPTGLHCLGTLSEADLQSALAERPVYVSAARYEPFGLAVLEAAQAGCALLLGDIATLRELWDGAALFVTPGDAAGFATALDRLVADPALRARLAAAASDQAEGYALDVHTDRMASLYQALLMQPARAGARVA